MRLICNDKSNQYYWVDANNVQRSPIFDYEQDALNWREQSVVLKSESSLNQDARVQLNG
jgi:hypothetical protein